MLPHCNNMNLNNKLKNKTRETNLIPFCETVHIHHSDLKSIPYPFFQYPENIFFILHFFLFFLCKQVNIVSLYALKGSHIYKYKKHICYFILCGTYDFTLYTYKHMCILSFMKVPV